MLEPEVANSCRTKRDGVMRGEMEMENEMEREAERHHEALEHDYIN